MLMIGTAATQSVMSHLHNKVISLICDSIQSDLISLYVIKKSLILFLVQESRILFWKNCGDRVHYCKQSLLLIVS